MKKLHDDDGGDEYWQCKAVGQVAEMSSLSIGMDRLAYCTHIKTCHGMRTGWIGEDLRLFSPSLFFSSRCPVPTVLPSVVSAFRLPTYLFNTGGVVS